MGRQRKESMNVFTKNLLRLMSERGVSIRQAAEYAGVSPSTVNSWRSGSAPTDFNAVHKLAKGLGVSFEFLLTGKDEGSNHQVSITEVFEEQKYFDGYCRVRIDRLIPRSKDGK